MSACGWLLWNQRNGEEQEWLWGIFMMLFILLMCTCLISCKRICPNVARILEKCHFWSVLDSWALVSCYVGIRPFRPLLPLVREASRFISVTQELISSSLLFFHLKSSFSFCFFSLTASWCSNLPPPSGFHLPLSPGATTMGSSRVSPGDAEVGLVLYVS